MEELKLLIGMVSGLPTMAIWVIVFYFIYKVIIVGSIYGVIKLGIRKLHEVLIKKKEADITTNEYKWSGISKITISSDNSKRLIEKCLTRIAGKRTGIDSYYIHYESAQWLEEAINEKEQRDIEDAREKQDVGQK